jgi:peptidoglycan/LPS O-acetylase OafA/YrhL
MTFTRFSNYLWNYGLYWYPFFFITPGLCVLMSVVFRLMDRCAWGRRLVGLIGCCGKYTFEIYLVHIFLFEMLSRLEKSEVLVKSNGNILITIVLVFPLSLGLHKLSGFFRNCFERRLEL